MGKREGERKGKGGRGGGREWKGRGWEKGGKGKGKGRELEGKDSPLLFGQIEPWPRGYTSVTLHHV